MRAVVFQADGKHTVERLPVRAPGKGQVRVKVHAAALNPADVKLRDRVFVSRFLHNMGSPLQLGFDFAGVVDAVGEEDATLEEKSGGSKKLAVGDRVFGFLPYDSSNDQGSLAEFLTIQINQVAVLPDTVPFHIGAAAPTVAITALQSLVDEGEIKEGDDVLVIGGGGGVGAFAVGMAKRLGAKSITVTCSAKDIERAKANGATVVIDRNDKEADIFKDAKLKAAFNIVYDTPPAYSFTSTNGLLKPKGTYVTTIPDGAHMGGKLHSIFSSKRCRCVFVASRTTDLEKLGGWLAGGLDAGIDSRFPIKDITAAFERQVDSARSGKVVVDVEGGWGSED